jgi:hypothetical protein
MEQHHTTEQDFQAKQLPWTNSGVERQTKNPTMDAFLLSIIFRDDFKNRWLQKMSNYKKYNTTSTAIIALIQNRRIHQQQYNMISTTSPAASTGESRIGL